MAGNIRFILSLACVCHAFAGLRHKRPEITTRDYGIDPIFGPRTPSKDTVDFMDNVFRRYDPDNEGQGDDEHGHEQHEQEQEQEQESPAHESGEVAADVRPAVDEKVDPNLGFELYWPGGEWVFKKAAMERCNSTGTACHHMLKRYGPVCAGNHDLTAHTSFDTMCDMFDANCRDGTSTLWTSDHTYSESIQWIPVTTSGYIYIQIAATETSFFALTRAKNIYAKPKRLFQYGLACTKDKWSCVRLFQDDLVWDVDYWKKAGRLVDMNYANAWDWSYTYSLLDRKIRRWKLSWNATAGFVQFELLDYSGKSIWPMTHEGLLYRFPAKYLGVWGGTGINPTWWEISGPGVARGFLMAYAGKCREDLPTLPTEIPVTLRNNLDIEQYNFAERMDDFGYNFTRVPTTTRLDETNPNTTIFPNYYEEDATGEYPDTTDPNFTPPGYIL